MRNGYTCRFVNLRARVFPSFFHPPPCIVYCAKLPCSMAISVKNLHCQRRVRNNAGVSNAFDMSQAFDFHISCSTFNGRGFEAASSQIDWEGSQRTVFIKNSLGIRVMD